MALRDTILADYFYRFLDRIRIPGIEHPSVSPNQFTVLGLILAVMAPVGFYIHPVFGLICIVLSGSADAMDGLVAKNQGMHSVFGAFLDSSFDRISDFLYVMGFWVLFWESEQLILATSLIFACCLFAFMISYLKARAESLGGRCNKGLMERGLRTVYLIGWALALCVLPPFFETILWAGLGIFCILTFFTMIQRIVHIRSELSQ
ncbi:MAG: CDP-alcohol phosphatidyltransferase family protein [Deltaproteobacteria bacterium]|nr:CDP-alcohol phosphatidyltransferase family protein [Deltaproteobacteria bacterium]MBW1961974.1 CDP-alcohol phosphatidyltransferase family protein [Deltaproteobacteria bacterium]MBW2153307.1 CDP-alcohol phosphatidyltransferase family protein [Deltaproteobacteria bacterium]